MVMVAVISKYSWYLMWSWWLYILNYRLVLDVVMVAVYSKL